MGCCEMQAEEPSYTLISLRLCKRRGLPRCFTVADECPAALCLYILIMCFINGSHNSKFSPVHVFLFVFLFKHLENILNKLVDMLVKTSGKTIIIVVSHIYYYPMFTSECLQALGQDYTKKIVFTNLFCLFTL